jgi:hypothetical protein
MMGVRAFDEMDGFDGLRRAPCARLAAWLERATRRLRGSIAVPTDRFRMIVNT